MTPPGGDERVGGDDGGATERDGRTYRPYLLTGGRTRSIGRDIPIEALVVTRPGPVSAFGPRRPVTAGLGDEQRRIIEACRSPLAVAEIAVLLGVPLGVARVLVSDLAVTGHVEVCETVLRDERDLLRRLIAGVRAI
jgi:hypothetical protein